MDTYCALRYTAPTFDDDGAVCKDQGLNDGALLVVSQIRYLLFMLKR
jgi:hypothetical protein